MLSFEIKKILSLRTFVFSVSSMLVILIVMSFIISGKIGTLMDREDFGEFIEYSEENSQLVKDEYANYMNEMINADGDMDKIAGIESRYEQIIRIRLFYEKIDSRKKNLNIMKEYDNWNTDIKYSYYLNEEYLVGDYSLWDIFLHRPLYVIASIIIHTLLAILVMTSDNYVGNKGVLYLTKKGKKKIYKSKLIILMLFPIVISTLCFLIQIIIFSINGLELSLMRGGLFNIYGFLMAPSYMSIGRYVLVSLLGTIIVNMLISAATYFVSLLAERKILICGGVVILIVVAIMMKEIYQYSPAYLVNPAYFFENMRECRVGNMVIHKYLILLLNAIIIGMVFFGGTKLINRINREKL